MTFVNDKGGFHKKLTVTQNSYSESLTVLKNAFLKKTENYSLQVTDFFTNKSPELFLDDEPVLEIRQYENYFDDAYPVAEWPAYVLRKHTFVNYDSIIILLSQYTWDVPLLWIYYSYKIIIWVFYQI